MDCSVDGCTKPARSQTLCGAHYQKKLRHGTPTPDPASLKKPGPKPDPSKHRSRHNPDNPSRSRPKKEKAGRTHCKNGHELTEDNRYWHKATGSWVCRTCAKEATRRYRETKDTPRDLTRCRNGHLITPENTVVYASGGTRCRQCVKDNGQKQRLKKYGLTQEQYEELLTRQDGKCAVCKTPMDGVRNEHIDHDHATGQVRGLLCSHCNTAIGKFKDNPDILIAAAQYLMDSWRLSD